MSKPVRFPTVLYLAAAFSAFTTFAVSAKPFLHEFGEWREYSKAWLAVCPKEGPSPAKFCRAVTFSGKSGFFLPNRLAVSAPETQKDQQITFVMDDYQKIETAKPVLVTFSRGKTFSLPWGEGIEQNDNVINEFRIKRNEDIDTMVETMKSDDEMRVEWFFKDGTSTSVVYSLLGFTRAMGLKNRLPAR